MSLMIAHNTLLLPVQKQQFRIDHGVPLEHFIVSTTASWSSEALVR